MAWRHLGVAVALAAASQSAWAGWTEARSKHFVIYSEQHPKQLRQYAEDLERFDQAVRFLRGMEDPELTESGRLTVYVLPSQAAVASLVGAPGSGVAGMYIGRASGARAFVHRERDTGNFNALQAQTVFFHEYLHHLMLQELDVAVPAWVVEGAAELYATASINKDGSVTVGRAAQHRAHGLFGADSLPVQDMVGARLQKMSDMQMEQLYGRGWLLTHMLTFEPSRKGQLSRYVMGIQNGMTALDSARSAFGDLKVLSKDLNRYLEQRKMLSLTLAANRFKVAPVALRPLSPAESAVLPVVMRSERGVGKKTAPKVLVDARKVAARFPGDPVVLAALAEAETDAGNHAASVAAADQALALRPSYAKPMIMKARALLASAEAEPAKADWRAIRALIGRANRLDPDHAEPLMLFYRSYLEQGVEPTRNAVEGLLYAQRIVPQDGGLRMLAVRQLIADKKLAEARALFGPIANNPHAGKYRERLQQVQQALAQGNAAQATALLDAQEAEASGQGAGGS